ncbi:MAG: KEOPS complex subunit Cgi121 [Candidatus Diapherotrites archaeon]
MKSHLGVFFGRLTVNLAEETLKKLSERALALELKAQLVRAEKIAGKTHCEWAAFQAEEAFSAGQNLTRAWETEFLVRISGQRQIEKALDGFGLRKGKQNCALVVLGPKEKADKLKKWAEKELGFKSAPFKMEQKKVQEWFSVSDAELKALSDLKNPLESAVLERVALAGTE